MPLRKLYKDTYELGYNSRDFPTSIDTKSCQKLYNAFPGSPVPRPRDGISKWSAEAFASSNNFDEIIPWSNDKETIIVIDGKSFYAVGKNLAYTLLGTADVIDGTKFSWIRVQNELYIITDKLENDAAFIISENENGFVFRNANIVLPDHTISESDLGSGNITANKFFSVLSTIVKRDDPASIDAQGNPEFCSINSSTNNYNPGKLESNGDLDQALTIEVGLVDNSFDITITLSEAPDPQATHLRIYRTLEAADAITAEGLSYRWERDIPLVDGTLDYTYRENTSDNSLAGSLNFWETVGYNRMPAGTSIIHHKGIIWVGGTVTDDDFPTHRGRWYYSQVPLNTDFPEKWFSMFNTTLFFKDTSLDDQEDGSFMGIHDDDIIFVMTKNTVWDLRHGDTTLQPELISSTKGSIFSNSAVKIDEMLMYLSNEGPVYLEGTQVNTLREFAAGEVWPELWDGSKGYFFQNIDPLSVRSFYFKSTWWLCRDSMFVGMYMPTNQKGFGAMRVVPKWSPIKGDAVAVLGYNKCIIASNHHDGIFLWDFLDPDVKTDNGYIYTIESDSKAFYVNAKNPDLASEIYNILVHVRYTDLGLFNLTIIGDKYRNLFSEDYREENLGPLINQSVDAPRRNVLEQGFEEGLVGRVFEVSWKKEYRTPWDFQIKGFTLQHMILPEQEFEYQAGAGADLVHDALDTDRVLANMFIKDAGDTTRNISDYDIIDAGEAEFRRDDLNNIQEARDAGRSTKDWENDDAGDTSRDINDYNTRNADTAENRLSKLT